MTGLDSDKFDAVEIRPFQPNDLNQVTGLWHSCNLIRPWNDPKKDIARKLHVNPEWFLVAILGKEIVGSIGVSGAPGGEKDAACAQIGIDRITKGLGD